MKTAVIYARYSSDSQTEQSIEGQVRVCKQFAEKNDLLVVDQYIDRATTGMNDNRAAFQQMLRDSKRRQWSVVIVYKLDRFARNKYESVVNRKKLTDNGVELVSAMENIPDTPEGKLFLAVIEGFNEYFSEDLKQKVNRGLRESWLKGNATGGKDIGEERSALDEVLQQRNLVQEHIPESLFLQAAEITAYLSQGVFGAHLNKGRLGQVIVGQLREELTD